MTTGIANTVGVRRTETALIVWSELAPGSEKTSTTFAEAPPQSASGETFTTLLGADFFYDSGSKGCGEGPLDEIAGKLRRMQAGETLEVRATDPSVAVDLPAWCRMTGNALIDQQGDRYLIQRKED
ncbi:MAG: sulfurtransferase TusA family protein [Caldilineales bacterium]